MDEVIGEFVAEAREGLEALDSELVRFEQNPDDPALLGGVFRLVHTMKGASGFLGLMRLQMVAHAAENALGAFRDGTLPVTPPAVTAILDTVDLIRLIVEDLARTGAEPAGDDSALIRRLDGLLAGPADDDAVTDMRPLTQRLGGEATLDAAVESAWARIVADPAAGSFFICADPDLAQGVLRAALFDLAAGREGASGFAAVLDRLAGAPAGPSAVVAAFDALAASLHDLDVPSAAVAELRALCLPAAEAQGGRDHAQAAPSSAPALQATEEAAPALTVPAAPAAPPEVEGATPGQTIRVSVDALEHLMTVVSELVLIRNQLIQVLRLEPESAFAAPLNRLNQVTTELQEGVMTTRMQPISGAWSKLPRLVRDLANDLGKKIDLHMTGQDTELDRQVLELIKDPLTHMIRNAADHGLERPEQRLAAGKPEAGRITLQARHEGGAIVIEVSDDGRGLDAARLRGKALATGLITPAQAEAMSDAEARHLIFRPGLSTAAQVTNVSGRGVGMDVVRTNIERIGGAIELASVEGAGTCFTIRIPLTLTIVSALIVECCGERFAMPQASVVELVSASCGSGREIEYVNDQAVLRLRDRLLPLVPLGALLGLPAVEEATSETCIVVARVGGFTFGVIVDRVFDTEEIVVKPVATVLRHLKLYSGATILGDGSVILILDFKGVSQEAGAGQAAEPAREEASAAGPGAGEATALLVFTADDLTPKAVPLSRVARIEEVTARQVERVEGRTVMQYRGELMPVTDVEGRPVRGWEGPESRPLLVFVRAGESFGVLVDEIVDIVEVETEPGALARGGSLVVAGAATELIDLDGWRPRAEAASPPPLGARRLLVIDRSPFTQLLLRPLLARAGYDVTLASEAADALAIYESGEDFELIMAETETRGDEARRFAAAFGRATRWHATPLVGLSFHGADRGEARFDGSSLLSAVSAALSTEKAAA